jgi:negative regulator of sigma-B (phosphoserine phosphatase)
MNQVPIDIGVSRWSLTDPRECGDSHLVAVRRSAVLVAVLDGLGHGHDAATATRAAIEVLESHPDEDVQEQILHCHTAARGTRGLVMGVARIDWERHTVTWAGVGNVQGVLMRNGTGSGTRDSLVAGSGVVGDQLPTVSPTTLPFDEGDVLVMWTDGLDAGLADSNVAAAPAQQLTERLLERFATGRDDALVLAARFEERKP